MTNDEILALGDYCANLKAQENFKLLVKQFELQSFDHFLTTEPHESKKREGIYASFSGVRDFIGNMTAIIDEAQKIIDENKPAPSEYDALPQEFN